MYRTQVRSRTAIITFVVIVGLLFVMIALLSTLKRVEPGFAGCPYRLRPRPDPGHEGTRIEQVPSGRFVFINPITQRLAVYPVSNQTLTMARRVEEGKVQGDDSIKVVDTNGVTLNMDVSVIYRVMPDQVGQLYTEWAGAPLIDPRSTGGDVEDRLVRPAVRSIFPNSAVQPQLPADLRHAKRPRSSRRPKMTLRAYLKDRHIDVVALQDPRGLSARYAAPGHQQQGRRAAVSGAGRRPRCRRTRRWPRPRRSRPKVRPSRGLIRAKAEADSNIGHRPQPDARAGAVSLRHPLGRQAAPGDRRRSPASSTSAPRRSLTNTVAAAR